MTPTKFYESIGANPEDPTKSDQAQLAAYIAYGPQREVGGFRGMDLADIVVASQMGRGAPAYVSSALKLRQAEDVRDTNINTQRGQLLKEYLKPEKFNNVVLIDKDAAQKGLNPYFQGLEGEDSGKLQVFDPVQKEFIDAGPNFIKKIGTGNVKIEASPTVKFIDDTFGAFYEKERNLSDLMSIGNSLVNQISNISDEELTPGSAVSSMVNIADRLNTEFGDLKVVMGLGADEGIFATPDKLGGSRGRVGDGSTAKAVYEILNDPDASEEDIELATKALDEMLAKESGGQTLKDFFGDSVYNNVRIRSKFLQAAYVLAAVNGQTGRTLSDKDLAFHIEMIGLGQTINKDVLVRNITDLIGDSINQVENSIKLGISQQFPKMRLEIDDPYVQTFLSDFYVPNQKDVDGNYIFSRNLNDYTFRPFDTRRSDIQEIGTFIKTDPVTSSIRTTGSDKKVIDDSATSIIESAQGSGG